VGAHGAVAQNSPAPASKPQTPPPASEVQSRITIEVTGGEKSVPVENASVYVKFIEEHSIKKDKKVEMNVKTSRDGIAHVPNAPMGKPWSKLSPKVGRRMDAGLTSPIRNRRLRCILRSRRSGTDGKSAAERSESTA